MTKAKIVLSTLALIAVIGGTSAFKAQRFGAGIYRSITGTTTVTIFGLPVTYELCGSPDFLTTFDGPISTFYNLTTSFSYLTVGGKIVTVRNICTGQTTSLAFFIQP